MNKTKPTKMLKKFLGSSVTIYLLGVAAGLIPLIYVLDSHQTLKADFEALQTSRSDELMVWVMDESCAEQFNNLDRVLLTITKK